MSINLLKEELYSLRDIVRFVPRSVRTGRRVHRSVVYRWAKRGLKAADGTRVFLEVVKAGGGLATSREALHRLFSELTARASLQNDSSVSTAKDGSEAAVRSRQSNVERQLDDAGF